MADGIGSLGFELAEICVAESVDRARSVLQVLMNATGAVAGLLAGPDGVRTGPVLAVQEYSPPLVEAITGDFTRGPSYRALADDPVRPLRSWRDVGEEFVSSAMTRDLLIPAGYRGGVSMRIVDETDGYVGDLHLSTTCRSRPTESGMVALHRVRPILAGLCRSELPRTEPVHGTGDDASVQTVARLIVCSDGRVETLLAPGGPEGSRLRALAASLSRVRDRRDVRCLWSAADGRPFRVQVRYFPDGASVTVLDAPVPYGLTHRETEVLSYVWAGLSNYSISIRTGVRERTVAAHVSSILAKTGTSSRARAAVLAEREGLVWAGLLAN
ncbi:LuxR C-terminal-related transcriptional regulator [Gordonia sp. PS3]|uniref:helix-turn-helix transcriptional regulator n=1 Tax=Gordonia TaxID=2053 RepID=UPI001C92DD17|nr:LuxR C-terminal-related transcriptional regulator [Gordonia sihwensis]WFN92944.1 LuxR C-terminal-related transcriptional regulator [Gordonia sihwensis]